MIKINPLVLGLCFFFIFDSSPIRNNEVLKEMQKNVDYQKGEFLFLNFINLGDCSKCLNLYYLIYNCIDERFDKKDLNFMSKYLVVVKCNREIELKRFRKLYSWDGFCFFNPGDVQKKLNLPQNTALAIFYNDSCLVHYTNEESILCDSLFRFIYDFLKKVNNY